MSQLPDATRIAKWIDRGELGEKAALDTVGDIHVVGGRAMEKAGMLDALGDVLFQAEDGKYYTANVELVINEADEEFVQEYLV